MALNTITQTHMHKNVDIYAHLKSKDWNPIFLFGI